MPAPQPVRQVLYVEDQPVNVMLMQAVFEQRPELQLVVATTCAEARALAARIRPELLLLDLRLPDGNGHELLPQLRQRPGWSRLTALRERRSCGFESPRYEVLVRPGPRLAEAAEIIADCLAGLGAARP